MKETHATDGVVNLLLIAIALTIVTVIAVMCLPDRCKAAGSADAFAQSHSWLRRDARPLVSYDNPAVRRTLHIPWSKGVL